MDATTPEENYSPYCPICSACGEEGCCSPMGCQQHKDGHYCQSYLRDLKFGYTMNDFFNEKIYNTLSDELKKEYDEMWELQYDRIYKNN